MKEAYKIVFSYMQGRRAGFRPLPVDSSAGHNSPEQTSLTMPGQLDVPIQHEMTDQEPATDASSDAMPVPSESMTTLPSGEPLPAGVFSWVLQRDRRPLPNPTEDEIRARMGRAFLVQLNITHAGVALGFSAYTGLWRSLQRHTGFIPSIVPDTLWVFTSFVALVVFSLLIVRAFRYPHLLKRDFTNNRLTSFFASPAIVMGTLALSVPEFAHTIIGMRTIFYALLLYQTSLALYWYGDWLFATGYSLRAIHSSYFMATTEFFILGALGALVDCSNLAKMSLSVGILFWLLVFVAVFAFLSKTLADAGEKATPTMFLFIAPPATAAIAHMNLLEAAGQKPLMDDFTWFFVSVTFFIYLLLMRVFRQYWTRRFSITWWAYIFPLSTAANLATVVAGTLDQGLPWVIATIATCVATLMIVIVVMLTVRKVGQGAVPRDDNAIRAHYQKLMDKEWEAKKASVGQHVFDRDL